MTYSLVTRESRLCPREWPPIHVEDEATASMPYERTEKVQRSFDHVRDIVLERFLVILNESPPFPAITLHPSTPGHSSSRNVSSSKIDKGSVTKTVSPH